VCVSILPTLNTTEPGRFTRQQPVWVPPTAAPVYSGPIIILTGGSAMQAGRTFDGTGISPDLHTPAFTDEEFAADRDSAFDQAIALLSQR
jgi:hypothetical protein